MSWLAYCERAGRASFHNTVPGTSTNGRFELTDWQRPLAERHAWQLLRGLIHADGCRFINTGRCG